MKQSDLAASRSRLRAPQESGRRGAVTNVINPVRRISVPKLRRQHCKRQLDLTSHHSIDLLRQSRPSEENEEAVYRITSQSGAVRCLAGACSEADVNWRSHDPRQD